MATQELTQPATQPTLDPRRLGQTRSGLADQDVTDIMLMLNPTSATAVKIVENMARIQPQHVYYQTDSNSFDSDIEEQETFIINEDGQQVRQSSAAPIGIALRLSSASILKEKHKGFVFGRNPLSSDILFGQDTTRRISNQHFRIYFNHNGLEMIADTSTNGTMVDGVALRSKDLAASHSRMITQGSIIRVEFPKNRTPDMDVIQFTVQFPSRGVHAREYEEKKRLFISDCAVGDDRVRALQMLRQRPYRATMKWDGGDLYNIIGELGKGAFATVYQLATKMDGKLLAAKELQKRHFMRNGILDKKIKEEIRIMESLRHPNIIRFEEYHDQGDFLYIVMEYAPYGDLQKHLGDHGPISEDFARPLAEQVLVGLQYLHRANITHRDIKPDNILIASFNPLQVKISDFGLSKKLRNDETFLKTFCGTLLYCAPEVFPNFHDHGTKRRRGVKRYDAYSSSVDIWSFGGVLWFALCGLPPFKGIADATGEAMYKNIMATKLDPTPLKERSISENCIDFLTPMLRTDPSTRPTETECLSHRWIGSDRTQPEPAEPAISDPLLKSIIEEEEEEEEEEEAEQQFSQLSLNREIPESDDEEEVLSDEYEMLLDSRRSKRVRTDPLFPRNQMRDYEDDSSEGESFLSVQDLDKGFSFENGLEPMPASGRQRLFGEIGQSALQNAHVHVALADKGATSAGPTGGVPALSQVGGQEQRQPIPAARAVPQLDDDAPSSSLLGTESMVREMNMTSPQSPSSGPHSPDEPPTPKTPEVPQHNSLDYSSKQPSQNSEPTPKANPPKLDRQITLPETASRYWDPFNKKTHTLEYASKVSGFDFVGAQQDATDGASELLDTMRQSTSDEYDGDKAESSSALGVAHLSAELGFKPPPRRLGKLIATGDSFAPNLVLNIDQGRTSWGRLKTNTIVYENMNDVRIPKVAFIIFWWSSQRDLIENVQQLSQQSKDWTKLSDLHVGIMTCATSGIAVNGKRIMQQDAKGRDNFGELHTGDIIQVYHGPNTERLKFKCEFYLGEGKEPRSSGNSFSVLPGGRLPAAICHLATHGQPQAPRRITHTTAHCAPIVMRNFWALPAVLRITFASQHSFNVFDDLLAFPQYDVVFPQTYITEDDASSLLSHTGPRSTSPATATVKSQETLELSKPSKASSSPSPSDDILEQTYERVVVKGQRYLCSIPIIPEESPQNSTVSAEEAKAEEEKELMRATDRGWELLQGMQGSCIYYVSGWWSYSFCYKAEVKQFHQLPAGRNVPIYPPVEDTSVKSFVLGKYPEHKEKRAGKREDRKTLGTAQGSKEAEIDDEGNAKETAVDLPQLKTKGASRYMVQKLSGGTECDLTGKDRKIEVQYHCHPQATDRIAMIKEVSTCSYLMIIYTPRLCNDVAFLPPQEDLAHHISCQPVLSPSEIDTWTLENLEYKVRETERLIEEAEANNPLREMEDGLEGSTKRGPVIGGIEVGAQALVGGEGRAMERSVIVGGGKEINRGTLLTSDGMQMSQEDMKKLGISQKAFEKLKDGAKKMSHEGEKWKLEVIEMPGFKNFEYRLIVEDEAKITQGKSGGKEGGGKGEGKTDEKGRGMKKEGEGGEEEKESQDGSEEVYKDEL
ncbi:Pkinase-domain-containing protein [Massarina eburnea CBS 473.64]|uniref:Pkinase-domain-containing protein n=1 Tax=Massarina eburnea CBS 473.64 TaxID=1395130 RepID=A0A6A6RQ35_9PLEO|nr:Pkinase-domain-containing protein [Massarina eburnea CBS 473.64]